MRRRESVVEATRFEKLLIAIVALNIVSKLFDFVDLEDGMFVTAAMTPTGAGLHHPPMVS